ncbi:amidase domain-containing protein [Spirillospora albida]|uniref:amidase domain-containing protein n=1 Tax=Spirillospora albida TaxID=58123 RepID=UPI00147033DC|nr:amidase domain-containing protein [Spirillospora albida]
MDSDATPTPAEINAYTPEQEEALPQPPDEAFAPSQDLSTTPSVSARASSTLGRASSGLYHTGIATWAIRNAKTHKQRHYENCTNFVSHAINKGGGARHINGWYEYRGAWWTNWLRDSWTWAGAENSMQHFTTWKFGSRGTRGYWQPTYAHIQVGDTIFFRRYKGRPISHAAIVSRKTKNNKYGIYMAQQTRTTTGRPHGDTYKPLWPTAEEYVGGVGFVWVRW